MVFTTVDYTREMFDSAMSALIEGSILAVAVVWLFLRNWRATAISALAIPLSAIPTFAFMQWMGFTLNQISLLALSLVAGVLVDDAIVEIENIVRHMRMGKSGFKAALDAADEIGLAVVATSATIIAVFLPVSFMPGITGQYFMQFGLTVAAAVFFSLLVARLITPVIAAFTLRRRQHRRAHGRARSWRATCRCCTGASSIDGARSAAAPRSSRFRFSRSACCRSRSFPKATAPTRNSTSSCRPACGSSRRPRFRRRRMTS